MNMKITAFQILITALLFDSFAVSAPLARIQVCGKDLDKNLAEVCNGRGFNVAFRSDIRGSLNSRRPKRGVVDECCRRYCSYSTLESYCSPVSSPSPAPLSDSLAIRKRNGMTDNVKILDESTETQDASRLAYTLPEMEDIAEQTRHHKRKLFAHSDSDPFWQGSSQRFNAQFEKSRNQILHEPYLNNKVKRNDPPFGVSTLDATILNSLAKDMSMNEALLETEEILSQLVDTKITKDRIRHPRTHSSRVLKLKESSQIGTVSPYFLGRTLVLPSSRKIRLS